MDEEEAYELPEANFSDPVAERTEAFSRLAMNMASIKDEEIRELAKIMLKMVIRSIKTPPDAELAEIG